MIEYSEPFIARDFAEKTDEELIEVFEGWYRTVNLAQPVLEGYQLVGGLLETRIRELLASALEKRGEPLALMDDYIKRLNIPKKKIGMNQEEEELLQIVAELQATGTTIEVPSPTDEGDALPEAISEAIQSGLPDETKERLKKHFEEWQWISTHHFIGDPYDHTYFYCRIAEMLGQWKKEGQEGWKWQPRDCASELRTLAARDDELQQRCEKLQRELHSEKQLLLYIDIAQDLSYLKPVRVDSYYIAWTNLRPMFVEIGKRVSVTVDELMLLTDKEIVSAIRERSVDALSLSDRKESFAVVKIDGELEMLSGDRLKEVNAKLTKRDYSSFSEVTGKMAFEGHVTGKVTVLHCEDDMPNVEQGDIVVISMTDPNYMPVIKKCGAIVTDYGGMLCHAAITAREHRIPCVMGTEIATRVFKSGDVAEVDAVNGVVRRIERTHD
ncbi:PEP-utilizing enzyme [Rubripirellula tenax]|nr:PEP-utilizing enzyme [Rubripirellula tenax]